MRPFTGQHWPSAAWRAVIRKGQDKIKGNWVSLLSLTPWDVAPALALGCSVKRKGVLPEGQVGKGRTVGRGSVFSHSWLL